jgi:hypothetical protein
MFVRHQLRIVACFPLTKLILYLCLANFLFNAAIFVRLFKHGKLALI